MANLEVIKDENNNTIAEVYTNQIMMLADQFVEERLEGDETKVKKYCQAFLYFIHDRIKAPETSDIKTLDALFGVYIRLCAKYDMLPTMGNFGTLIDVDISTMSLWIAGEYRRETHQETARKWKSICQNAMESKLSNSESDKGNINLIFLLKANYGYRETAPVPAETPKREQLTAAELPKLGEFSERKLATIIRPNNI